MLKMPNRVAARPLPAIPPLAAPRPLSRHLSPEQAHARCAAPHNERTAPALHFRDENSGAEACPADACSHVDWPQTIVIITSTVRSVSLSHRTERLPHLPEQALPCSGVVAATQSRARRVRLIDHTPGVCGSFTPRASGNAICSSALGAHPGGPCACGREWRIEGSREARAILHRYVGGTRTKVHV